MNTEHAHAKVTVNVVVATNLRTTLPALLPTHVADAVRIEKSFPLWPKVPRMIIAIVGVANGPSDSIFVLPHHILDLLGHVVVAAKVEAKRVAEEDVTHGTLCPEWRSTDVLHVTAASS